MTLAQSGGGAALEYIPGNVGLMETPEIAVGVPATNAIANPALPQAAPAAGATPLQIWITAGMALWTAGIAFMLLYGLIGYIRIRRRVSAAVRLENGVFQADMVRSPFILGLFRPGVYIPFGLNDQELRYVLLHERTHIRRGDHWIGLLSYLALTVHWFNPLVWLAHFLMIRDMEMSCDENVLAQTGENGAHEYSASCFPSRPTAARERSRPRLSAKPGFGRAFGTFYGSIRLKNGRSSFPRRYVC
jgi:beta-lactamase regulating signal transducer with metallopeptidase domain